MTLTQLREAVRLGVVLRDPIPTPEQWARIAADLWCEPEAGRAFRLAHFGQSVTVSRAQITAHPAYWGLDEAKGWAGSGNPVPIVWTERAYPIDGGQTGSSVVLHECGHATDVAITARAPVIAMRYVPLWARADYQAVHATMLPRRVNRMVADSAGEYWAEDYSCFWLWDAGHDAHIREWFSTDSYLPVRVYMKNVLYSAGYRDFRRAI